MSKEEKKRFKEFEEEILKDDASREIMKKMGLRLQGKEVIVQAPDWNWLVYALSQFSKVMGWMYGSLNAEEVERIENTFDTEIKDKRTRAYLKYLFEEFKKTLSELKQKGGNNGKYD
jgi:phosphoglycolate phosphatase-like HAD superfamily hydrolase